MSLAVLFCSKALSSRITVGLGIFCLMALPACASASDICVSPQSKHCFRTIGEAVAAASPGDVIRVAAGTYAEDVHITQPLSLLGENRENTIVMANGQSNGIYIDGLSSPGLAHVTVSGFTVAYANHEGILVQNASDITLWDNVVRNNDLSLQISNSACPGLPPFETNEGDDCGEGIHLMGVDHSTVYGNLVEQNAGGILLSDETAPNRDNAITNNIVRDNPYDCGITLASHGAYVLSGTAPPAFGIYHNTISGNESRHNGYGSPGGGAGVGIFAPGPGNINVQNSVVGNRLIDNSLPGVTIHNHVFLPPGPHPPNPNVNDNVITGNYIAGNLGDDNLPNTAPAGIAVLGVTPITGLVISNNTIRQEQIDVAIDSASETDLHLNVLDGGHIGVANLSAGGVVNATENWWGCPGGPTANGCSTILGTVVYTPWLTTPVTP